MEIDYVAIGGRIREIRKKRKWTQARLPEASGVEASNISHIERAATKVSLPTLVRIANALEATLDELACGSLIKNSHVLSGEAADLFADCSAAETAALIEMIKTTKSILRCKN